MDWEKQIKQIAEEAWKEIHKESTRSFSGKDFTLNYRAEHNESVLSIGMKLGRILGADSEILKAALYLHDIGRRSVKKGHAEAGAQMTAEILKDTDFPPKKIDDVKYAISSHVGWDEGLPKTLEARILWDADKLSKLGATIILHRAILWPLQGKNSLDIISDLNAWLETAEYIKNHMKTEPGSKMAKVRYQTFKKFVTALNEEYSLK